MVKDTKSYMFFLYLKLVLLVKKIHKLMYIKIQCIWDNNLIYKDNQKYTNILRFLLYN